MRTIFTPRSGVIFLLLITFSISAHAGELPRFSIGGEVIQGRGVGFAKAGGDTINLMSTHDDPTNGPGEPYYYGDFENESGSPNWNEWTHYDITQPFMTHWNVSNYNQADPLNHAAWCGDIAIPACTMNDTVGGYGNNWHDLLEFRQTVAYPDLSTTVTVTATLIHDSEPGYDFTYLSYRYDDQPHADIQSWDGTGTEAANGSVTYLPVEYVDGTDIVVTFRFRSDGGYSDHDCFFPSSGGCQVDDINVNILNGLFEADFFEDFEHDGAPDDFGLWDVAFLTGVGDFANIWEGLQDIDPCRSNSSPQVAFIDDGQVVPGTGGSECLNWCYGPGGYIVTTTGGLGGPNGHIHTAIESPVMDWPAPPAGEAQYDGIRYTFGVYQHEDLSHDAPGIFYTWGIRSADTDGSAGNGVQTIGLQGWQDRNFVYMGNPEYFRRSNDVPNMMNPGRDEVQVQLAVFEIGWIWNFIGNDGYPAPYFDNVTVKVYPHLGPGMSAREIDLAQDNFPERGTIDTEDLGSHSVRFDMAHNISTSNHLRNDPGDSIVIHASPLRAGAELDGPPELHYIVKRNPVFDPYRTAGLPALGWVAGMPAVGLSGIVTPGRWAFDLPDTGFLFPGDILHYYISATDAIGGTGGSDPQTSLIPPDTTGFSRAYDWRERYNSSFTVQALPSIHEDVFGGHEQPKVLFINDFGDRGGENKWHGALMDLGFLLGQEYDTYYVNSPSSGIGNGIGGRANHLLLSGYDEVLYTCGDLSRYTITNGDYTNDAGDDVGTLKNWLDLGRKDMFLTGDNLAWDLAQSGIATHDFLENYLGLSLVTSHVRPFLDNQTSPLVKVVPGNPIFFDLQSWIAYGGCFGLNTFDGVLPLGAGTRLAEFSDPSGSSGSYPYSAATLNVRNPGPDQSRIVSMPVDLMFVYTDPDGIPSGIADRTRLLGDVLQYFGAVGSSDPSDVGLPGIPFQAKNHPNPFNPKTTITFAMPRAGHVDLKVFNVRGQLVKTLVDGVRPAGAGQVAVWDGTDDRGSAAASGVYFYEVRAGGEVRIGKMTLLK